MTMERRCTFCGHHEDDVRKLIAGKDVFICAGCVDGCAENFSGGSSWDPVARTWVDHAPLSPWPRQRQSHFGDNASCSFCGKAEADLQWLVGCSQPHTFICDECVGACLVTLREPAPRTPSPADGRPPRRRWTFHWPWQNPQVDKATSL